jgi:hypothetical protein
LATRAFPVTVVVIAGVVAVDRVMLVADATTMFAFWTRAAAISRQWRVADLVALDVAGDGRRDVADRDRGVDDERVRAPDVDAADRGRERVVRRDRRHAIRDVVVGDLDPDGSLADDHHPVGDRCHQASVSVPPA